MGRNNHGFRHFCITNEAIPTKPVSDALEVLVDIVHSFFELECISVSCAYYERVDVWRAFDMLI